MTSGISRRTFLKGAVATAGTVAAAGAPVSAGEKPPHHLATLIDISRCIGCEECVFACREANSDKFPEPEKPFPKMHPESRVRVEDWSEKRDVTDRLTPYNWLYIQHALVSVNGEDLELNIPRRCMHCENPPCVKLCPWGAAKQEKNGLSRIDPGLCLGGAKCRTVCPWEVPMRQTGTGLYLDLLPGLAGNGVMYKCDRCYDRLEQGETPACIEACPEDAQMIGPREEILQRAHRLAEKMNGYVYGEHENGGTHTIYVSPVPFDQLNNTVETGEGRPGFPAAENRMADGNRLALAMLIAPVAGILSGIRTLYKQPGEDA